MNYIENYLEKIGMIPDMLDGLFILKILNKYIIH